MSNKRNGVKWSKQAKARLRRASVIDRLTTQLKEGHKTVKGGDKAPLSEKDTKRISKEIETLKARI